MIKKEEKRGNMLSDKSTFRQHCIYCCLNQLNAHILMQQIKGVGRLVVVILFCKR